MQADDPGKSKSCCGPNGLQNGVEINGKPAEEISTDSEQAYQRCQSLSRRD